MEGEAKFCPRCGSPLSTAEVDGRMRQRCPECGFVLYRNPIPGTGVLVEMDNGIVLVQRGQPPFVGWWVLPSGYIEADESAEQAAIRECKEETGLDVELVELFGVYSFPEGPVHSGIVIFYRARPVGGTLRPGDDAQDVGVFPPHALPEKLAFRTHREVLARWARTRVPTPSTEAAGIIIRDARPEDEERVMELLPLIPSNASLGPGELQAVARRFRESLAMDILVAEAEGRVVGFIALSFAPVLSGLRALVDDLAVDPAYRRQGIGAALVEAAVQRANRRGATHLLVDTSRGDASAQKFYQACGFRVGEITTLRIR